MSNQTYQIGQRVDRIEDREITGATIISIQESTDQINDTTFIELQYDEGGTGWWTAECVRSIVT
jgi:phage terminase large subunit GpA-like protein